MIEWISNSTIIVPATVSCTVVAVTECIRAHYTHRKEKLDILLARTNLVSALSNEINLILTWYTTYHQIINSYKNVTDTQLHVNTIQSYYNDFHKYQQQIRQNTKNNMYHILLQSNFILDGEHNKIVKDTFQTISQVLPLIESIAYELIFLRDSCISRCPQDNGTISPNQWYDTVKTELSTINNKSIFLQVPGPDCEPLMTYQLYSKIDHEVSDSVAQLRATYSNILNGYFNSIRYEK